MGLYTGNNRARRELQMSSMKQEDPKSTKFVEKSFSPLFELSNSPTNAKNIVTMEEAEEEKDQIGIMTARALLLLVAILWGTNFASVKYLETLCFHPPCSHPPSEAALARFGVAALVSVPLLINQRKDIIMAGIECGIFITL